MKTVVVCWVGWSASVQACDIIDAYAAVARLAPASIDSPPSEQVRLFHTEIIDPFPGLYAESVLGVGEGSRFDAAILASLSAAREHPDRVNLIRELRSDIDRSTRAFSMFADFHCDFPIYIADTLGQLDGAGRVVDGKPALVLGVGNLDVERGSVSIPTLINHEFFHRYHYQAANFSDDSAGHQPIWVALWVEGLATYASQVLTPGASLQDALAVPVDLEQRAIPMVPQIAADLLSHLDETNPDVFTTYFTYGNADVARRGLPWRSGYYVGWVVASRLAQRHSLAVLAHWKGSKLHDEISRELRRLAKQ